MKLKTTQSEIREKLLKNIKTGKIPNAICFIDRGGRGSLKLASEIGLNIVRNHNASYNESHFIHPDLHFIYPTKVPKEEGVFKKGMTAFYIDKWREFMSDQINGSVDEWLDFSCSNNKPGKIRVGQIIKAIETLNLKPFQSDKKVCIIWGIKYLMEDGVNKLLKTIEEPPKKTYFILIGEDEKKILPTLASRCQVYSLPPFKKEEMTKNLNTNLARNNNEVLKERERLFINCLRGCFIAAKRDNFSYIIKNSDELGSLNKFDLQQLFLFGINFLRQSFIYSYRISELYEFKSLNDFSIENFALYVTDKNYGKLISLFELNLNCLDRNANLKLLSTSFLLELSHILYK